MYIIITVIMEFCKVCKNLLYIRTEEDQSLTHYCKYCKFEHQDEPTLGKAICISKTMYEEDDLLYMQHKNEYLRFDPTLPRVQDSSIICENKECTGDREKPQVIYVKYHTLHMKYFYACDYCGYCWRKK
jgi:DNA-directed RNA polymerase subunit M/transcription elongation factor TFIIS